MYRKTHLVGTAYHALLKLLLYNIDNLEKPRVLLLEPTGMSVVIIDGTTKSSTKLLGLNDKTKVNLIIKILEVKITIIHEISMVCRDLFYEIHVRFIEIFMC